MFNRAHANRQGFVHILMLITILLAASSFPVGAIITHSLPPATLMFLRFVIAVLLFAPYIFYKHGLHIPSRQALLSYTLISIPLVVFFWCMFESLRYTSVLNTGALYTLVPAMTALFAFIINGEASGKLRTLGLVLGTIGALWIVFRGDWFAFKDLNLNYGDLVFIIGCLFLGLYNPLIKKLYRNEPMEVMTYWVLIFGSIWLLMFSINEINEINWRLIETEVYVGVFYLALFTTLATFFLFQYGTIKIGPTKVGAYGFLTPIFVITITIAIGMEAFDELILPGMLLVFISMFLIQTDQPVLNNT